MSKKILMILTAVLLVGMTVPAFAAVQNIKVGGDITIRGIYRSNFDFIKDSAGYYDSDGDYKDSCGWLMTTTRIYVSAELTDGVAAVVRFINERDWGSKVSREELGEEVIIVNQETEIALDLAYIKFSDLLVPGLTATIGRQEILLGEGFVIGNLNAGCIAGNPTVWIAGGGGPVRQIMAGDYTARKAFDAIRADYEVAAAPLTLTGFVAKIEERYAVYDDTDTGLDTDLYALNANYQLATAEVEGYVINKGNARGTKNSANELSLTTFGARVAHNVAAVPGLSWKGEAALQSGDVGLLEAKGYAVDAGVGYAFQDITWEPKVGLNYLRYSGDDDEDDDDLNTWVPLYPDGCADRIGAIGYALIGPAPGIIPVLGGPNLGGLQVIKLNASIQPTEKLNISLAWFNNTLVETATDMSDELGNEIDLALNYAYSEDVAMGLLFGYFNRGKAIKEGLATLSGITEDDTTDAFEVVGTVAVSF